MRITVLSDTHIPIRLGALPGRVYEVCAESDLILHCGDVVERCVLRDLERFAPVKAVHGNMDPYDLQERYPEALEFELDGFRICMTHGRGPRFGIENRILARFAPRKPGMILFGHSHVFHHDVKDGVIRLNPGSPADVTGSRSFAVLSLEHGEVTSVEQVLF